MAAHPSPAQGILEELASGGHDLLVIGAPARRGLRRTAAPDVTSRILDRSDRPVLIVPISE
jgi:nucleotide-binding universal stress UspA family protein